MNDRASTSAYYEQLRRRLRWLVDALDGRMPPTDRAIVNELIDANECGVALETIVDAMVEDRVQLDGQLIREIADLATTMNLSSDFAAKLALPVAR